MKPTCKQIIVFAACLMSPLAQAHDNSLTSGLFAGLAHPLTGLDHLAALVLSGFLIGRLVRGKYLALAGLVGALGLGAVGGIVLGAQSGTESLVLLSLPVLLAFQWIRKPGRLQLAVTVMGLFMVAHGWAHGVEVQGGTLAFVSGFLLMSSVIPGLCALVSHYLSMSHLSSFRRMPESSARSFMDPGIRRDDGEVLHSTFPSN